MKNYRAEQVTKAMLWYIHRGRLKKFKLDRRKLKEWLIRNSRVILGS